MATFITYLYVAIGLTMVIFAGLQLSARKKVRINYWLGLLFLSFGYIWLYFGLYRLTRFAWAPRLLYSDVLVTFLLGPLMYGYTTSLAGEAGGRNLARRFLPFLPAPALMLYLILAKPALAIPVASLPGPNPDYYAIPAVGLFNTIGDGYFFVFAAISARIVVKLYRKGSKEFRKAFRSVLIYFIIGLSTFAVYLVAHLLSSDDLLALATLINGINSMVFFFLSYRYPEYSQRELRPDTGRARPTTLPPSMDVPGLLANLKVIIENERGYRDPKITLQSLSTRLGIQYYQLSQILSDSLSTNFRNYINKHRLHEAKQLLTEKPEMSILDIAYSVGFNSKSSFNAAFLKETSLSPSDYRKKTV